MNLLTRDQFREAVFKRDHHKCVVCGFDAKDAHHILERRLWEDGGYYLDNGAALCGDCHLKAESTEYSCEFIREKANINVVVLPAHFYNDSRYDKWGNILIENNKRLKGELFYDESVQKIIAPYFHLFTDYIKYPRTFHLPWSPGLGDKDKIQYDLSKLQGKEVVITEKMDGENTTMYRDHIHARSLTSSHHESRSWVKNLHAKIKYDIPESFRICGENLYAKHAISYEGLKSYFYVFSIWDQDICLSLEETLDWCNLLELQFVPIWCEDIFDENKIQQLKFNKDEVEGYVVRLTSEFRLKDFKYCNLKYVRAQHVQSNEHWLNSYTVKNNLGVR